MRTIPLADPDISRGGSRLAGGNLWPAHRACNQAKAARLPGEAIDVSVDWSALVAENAALRARVKELEALFVVGEPDAGSEAAGAQA